MNGKSANCRGLRLNQCFARRISTVSVVLSLSAFCIAATSGPNTVSPAPNAVVAALPVTTLSSSPSPRRAITPAPTQYNECLTLLRETDRVTPSLMEAVSSTLNYPAYSSQAVPQRSPSLMTVTYREQAGQARDVVVQLYFDPLVNGANVLNTDGYVRARLGDELSSSADQFLGLMFHDVVYFGQKDDVEHVKRAFQSAMNGDMTLLREETIEPLHVLVLMPHGGTFLPSSLRSRVRGLVLNAELAFGTWHGQVGMVTENGESAEQVGNIVAAWRDMAVSLADTFASHSSGKQLRESLKSSTIEVANNRVVASASVDSRTVVRATKEITGHGGGCPAGGICSSDKVAICHNIGKNEQTLCVAPSAVAAHLAQGDRCGPCDDDPGSTHGNNGVGNGVDPQPPGNPPVNDGPGTGPGNPGNRK